MKYIEIIVLFCFFSGCSPKEFSIISESDFKYVYQGETIELYTLRNENGLVCQLTNFGARVVSLYAPNRDGELDDIVVGYGTGRDFVEKEEYYFGAIIGRYGNRISDAAFSLQGQDYRLEVNDGENHLHGGSNGFHRQVWSVESVTESEIVFSHLSKDMEDGYPGNVDVKVRYQLKEDNQLKIEYFAQTDKATILNLTNHSYFNLKGKGRGDVTDHLLLINSDAYLPVDDNLIPIGISKVEGTPFDFRIATTIGKRIEDKHPQLEKGNGYDHSWVLRSNSNELFWAAKVIDVGSGRRMDVYTNEPGIQFYSGNFLDGSVVGKGDSEIGKRCGFCLETQHFPDSPNNPDFPCTVLSTDALYYSVCVYQFTIVADS